MVESIQHKLDRVRPPRVQITYDVEIGNAIVMKELPFIVGILADLSAKGADKLPELSQREFVYIDRDNFDDVLKAAAPRIALSVKDTLNPENTKTNIALKFSAMDDFNPASIVRQVPELNELFNKRQKLIDITSKLDGNNALDRLIKQLSTDKDKQQELLNLCKAETTEETPAESTTTEPTTEKPETPVEEENNE